MGSTYIFITVKTIPKKWLIAMGVVFICTTNKIIAQDSSLLLSQPKFEWTYVGKGNDNYSIYIKTEYTSFEKNAYPNPYYKGWVKESYPTYTYKGKTYKNAYSLTLYGIDCNNNKICTLQDILYNGSGNMLSSSTGYELMEDVVPGSVGEEIVKKACLLYKNK